MKRCPLTRDDGGSDASTTHGQQGTVKTSHRPAELLAAFSDADLVAHAGLLTTIRPAERCGPAALAAAKVRLSGAANAVWLTLAAIAYNLTGAASHLASVFHARARTVAIRRHLINIPARIATGARRLTLQLPQH
jgi:hypothetical protein